MTSLAPAAPAPAAASSIGRDAVFGVILNAVQVAVRLVTVPLIIGGLGLAGYAVWNSIVIAAAYLRIGALGVKAALQKYVAEATGSGDFERASRLLSTCSAAMLVLSILAVPPAVYLLAGLADTSQVPASMKEAFGPSIALLGAVMIISNAAAPFEAIVAGAHHTALLRKTAAIVAVLEAAALVSAIALRQGLYTMAMILAASELLSVAACFYLSGRVLPRVEVAPRYVSRGELGELLRYAGSYQLLNFLEVAYVTALPLVLLRTVGPEASAVYAIGIRLTSPVTMLNDSMLVPLLSGLSRSFARRDEDATRVLARKAIKATAALSIAPLGYVAVFGAPIAYAWTGQQNSLFPVTFLLVATQAVLASFSKLALILYRAAGEAVLDNVRQLIRLVLILAAMSVAARLGFAGVLSAMVLVEFIGLAFMAAALRKGFHWGPARPILGDIGTIALSSAFGLAVGAGVWALFANAGASRASAVLMLAITACVCMATTCAVSVRTGILTSSERAVIQRALRLR